MTKIPHADLLAPARDGEKSFTAAVSNGVAMGCAFLRRECEATRVSSTRRCLDQLAGASAPVLFCDEPLFQEPPMRKRGGMPNRKAAYAAALLSKEVTA